MEEIICKQCGLVNDYRTEQAGPHVKAICNGCDKYIKFVPVAKYHEVILYFGKYKGRALATLISAEELSWVQWAVRNCSLKPAQKESFTSHLAKYSMGV